MNKSLANTQFAALFKKYRLRSEIETLAEFGDLLAQEGIVYESSLFTRWQKGERVPSDRTVILKILGIFIKKEGLLSLSEANSILETLGMRALNEYEIKPLAFQLYTSTRKIISSERNKSDLKVYFAGSYKGKKELPKGLIKKLYDEIEILKYQNIDRDFLQISYNNFVKRMLTDKRELILHYYKKINSIHQSDICIFETTYPSLAIGFLIQKAIEAGKPTAILYYKGNISFFIAGIVNNNIQLYEYTEDNYKKVIKNALEDSKNKIPQLV